MIFYKSCSIYLYLDYFNIRILQMLSEMGLFSKSYNNIVNYEAAGISPTI